MEVSKPSHFGTVNYGKPETVELARAGHAKQRVIVNVARGTWRPPERLTEFLPENFSIAMDCYTTRDGVRRFLPCCNFEELIDLGAVGGLAVLQGINSLTHDELQSYRHMQLIHQFVRGRAYWGTHGMKEHYARNLNWSRDLVVRSLSSSAADERTVLRSRQFRGHHT